MSDKQEEKPQSVNDVATQKELAVVSRKLITEGFTNPVQTLGWDTEVCKSFTLNADEMLDRHVLDKDVQSVNYNVITNPDGTRQYIIFVNGNNCGVDFDKENNYVNDTAAAKKLRKEMRDLMEALGYATTGDVMDDIGHQPAPNQNRVYLSVGVKSWPTQGIEVVDALGLDR